MKCYLILFQICLITLLTGCQVIPSLNANEISIIQGVGFDIASQHKLLGTIVYPEYQVDETSKIEIKNAEGETVREIINRTQNEVQYPLVNGQLRIALFGEKLARKGLFPLLDTFNRSPAIGSKLQLAIVEGEASKLLSIKKYGKENIALYLSDMIFQNAKTGELPLSDLTIFSFKFYDEGSDPFLPILKKEKDKIRISGIALFKNARVVSTLPIKDAFTFKMLLERFKMGTHQYRLDENEHVVLGNIKSLPHYKVKVKNGNPEFNIQIKMDARIQEYSSNTQNAANPSKIKDVRKKIMRNIEQDTMRIIKQLQENDVDPLGLGAKFEAHYRNFELGKWEEQYPDVKVNVDVDLNIVHSGIIE
ncbi:Ger(x)C family spore germination protein [Fictibacillus nanhaiensis]|uniref:Ger(x)C family spore germination protein n=1 Tax=Fictibacillus nanhaiensis TaxID=742169 RepID=UPI002E1F7C86|nr:Ger(x)C family spore germination protein [Fictibacillus nanhaiensis]